MPGGNSVELPSRYDPAFRTFIESANILLTVLSEQEQDHIRIDANVGRKERTIGSDQRKSCRCVQVVLCSKLCPNPKEFVPICRLSSRLTPPVLKMAESCGAAPGER
jgi:hypothetical protein